MSDESQPSTPSPKFYLHHLLKASDAFFFSSRDDLDFPAWLARESEDKGAYTALDEFERLLGRLNRMELGMAADSNEADAAIPSESKPAPLKMETKSVKLKLASQVSWSEIQRIRRSRTRYLGGASGNQYTVAEYLKVPESDGELIQIADRIEVYDDVVKITQPDGGVTTCPVGSGIGLAAQRVMTEMLSRGFDPVGMKTAAGCKFARMGERGIVLPSERPSRPPVTASVPEEFVNDMDEGEPMERFDDLPSSGGTGFAEHEPTHDESPTTGADAHSSRLPGESDVPVSSVSDLMEGYLAAHYDVSEIIEMRKVLRADLPRLLGEKAVCLQKNEAIAFDVLGKIKLNPVQGLSSFDEADLNENYRAAMDGEGVIARIGKFSERQYPVTGFNGPVEDGFIRLDGHRLACWVTQHGKPYYGYVDDPETVAQAKANLQDLGGKNLQLEDHQERLRLIDEHERREFTRTYEQHRERIDAVGKAGKNDTLHKLADDLLQTLDVDMGEGIAKQMPDGEDGFRDAVLRGGLVAHLHSSDKRTFTIAHNGEAVVAEILVPSDTDNTRRAEYLTFNGELALEKVDAYLSLLGVSRVVEGPAVDDDEPETPNLVAENPSPQQVTDSTQEAMAPGVDPGVPQPGDSIECVGPNVLRVGNRSFTCADVTIQAILHLGGDSPALLESYNLTEAGGIEVRSIRVGEETLDLEASIRQLLDESGIEGGPDLDVEQAAQNLEAAVMEMSSSSPSLAGSEPGIDEEGESPEMETHTPENEVATKHVAAVDEPRPSLLRTATVRGKTVQVLNWEALEAIGNARASKSHALDMD